MKMKIKEEKGEIMIALPRSAIMQYAGKLHGKYHKKKVNIDRIRDLVNYSNL
jgi:hypothetical protein